MGVGVPVAIATPGCRWYKSNMDERLLLPLSHPPRLVAADAASQHGGSRPAEAYRLRRIWCLNLYQGHGELIWRGRRVAIRPGYVSLTAPDTDHGYSYRGEATLTWLHFLPEPAGDAVPVPLMQPGGPALLAQVGQAARCWRERPLQAQAMLWSVLWQLADHAPAGATALPVPVRRAMAHAEGRLAEPLTAGDLARAGGCSVTHLNRLFRQARGCAAMGWLRRRRLERAQHLLRCSTQPAVRIAADLGFVDLQHLSKSLRRATGRGPRAVRAEGGDEAEVEGAGFDDLTSR